MTAKRRGKRPSSGSGGPPAGQQSPKKQGQSERQRSRALARAGTAPLLLDVREPWELATARLQPDGATLLRFSFMATL